MPKRITDSEFRKRVKQKQGNRFEILSNFQGWNSKIKIKCNKCDWIGEVRAANIIYQNYGSRCPKHDHRQYDSSSFQKLVNQKYGNQFTVLSSYHGLHQNIKIKCKKCGWIGTANPQCLLYTNYGSKCPRHGKWQYDLSSFQKEINKTQDGQYTLLSEYVNLHTKVKVKCKKCGKKFYVWPENLLNMHIGKNCNHKQNKRKTRLTFEQAAKRLNEISDGEIELIHFSGMRYEATFKHLKCGNTWRTKASHVFDESSGCPFCSSSKGEKKVAEYLRENKISFKPQFTFPNCKDKRMLPFDFAVFNKDGSLNSLIEYQGCQHFMDPSQRKEKGVLNKESVLSTQKHDKMKSTFCKEHGIQLICINHPQTTQKSKENSFIVDLVKHTLDKELKVS